MPLTSHDATAHPQQPVNPWPVTDIDGGKIAEKFLSRNDLQPDLYQGVVTQTSVPIDPNWAARKGATSALNMELSAGTIALIRHNTLQADTCQLGTPRLGEEYQPRAIRQKLLERFRFGAIPFGFTENQKSDCCINGVAIPRAPVQMRGTVDLWNTSDTPIAPFSKIYAQAPSLEDSKMQEAKLHHLPYAGLLVAVVDESIAKSRDCADAFRLLYALARNDSDIQRAKRKNVWIEAGERRDEVLITFTDMIDCFHSDNFYSMANHLYSSVDATHLASMNQNLVRNNTITSAPLLSEDDELMFYERMISVMSRFWTRSVLESPCIGVSKNVSVIQPGHRFEVLLSDTMVSA